MVPYIEPGGNPGVVFTEIKITKMRVARSLFTPVGYWQVTYRKSEP